MNNKQYKMSHMIRSGLMQRKYNVHFDRYQGTPYIILQKENKKAGVALASFLKKYEEKTPTLNVLDDIEHQVLCEKEEYQDIHTTEYIDDVTYSNLIQSAKNHQHVTVGAYESFVYNNTEYIIEESMNVQLDNLCEGVQADYTLKKRTNKGIKYIHGYSSYPHFLLYMLWHRNSIYSEVLDKLGYAPDRCPDLWLIPVNKQECIFVLEKDMSFTSPLTNSFIGNPIYFE